MAQATYLKKIKVSTDNTTWLDTNAKTGNLNFNGMVLDDTNFANNAGYHTRLLGLLDWSVDCDIVFEPNNAALNAIRNSLLSRSQLYVQYLPQGNVSTGLSGQVVIESFNSSGDVEGYELVSVAMQGHGALSNAQ